MSMSANMTFLSPGEGDTVFTVNRRRSSSAPARCANSAPTRRRSHEAVALFVDPHVLASAPGQTALASLREAGLDVACTTARAARPNSDSFEDAAAFARDGASTASSRSAAAR